MPGYDIDLDDIDSPGPVAKPGQNTGGYDIDLSDLTDPTAAANKLLISSRTPEHTLEAEHWGHMLQTLDAILLGGGVPAMAALKAGTPQTTPEGGVTYPSYTANERQYRGYKEAWEQEHPVAAPLETLAGSLPTTMAAMGLGQEYGVVPLARTLAGMGRAGEFGSTMLMGGEPLAGVRPSMLFRNPIVSGAERTLARGVRGAREGATAGVLESGLNPDERTLKQEGIGALTGAITAPVMGMAEGTGRGAMRAAQTLYRAASHNPLARNAAFGAGATLPLLFEHLAPEMQHMLMTHPMSTIAPAGLLVSAGALNRLQPILRQNPIIPALTEVENRKKGRMQIRIPEEGTGQ